MKELLSSSRLRWAGVTRTTRSGTLLESVSDVVLSGELNFEDCQNQKYFQIGEFEKTDWGDIRLLMKKVTAKTSTSGVSFERLAGYSDISVDPRTWI